VKPADQAAKLEVPVEEIYRIKETTDYHLKKLRAAERGDEE
jgi:hypothetical protein